MFKSIKAGLAVTLLAFGTGAGEGAAEELTITSSTTVANAILIPYEARIEKLVGYDLYIRPDNSGDSVLALAAGRSEVAAVSAPLADIVTRLNAGSPGAVDGRKLLQHDIGSTRVAFVVHPSNPVKDLSIGQVADILAGRILYWSQLGGANVPIQLITEPKGGGIRTMVEKTIGKWGDVLTESRLVQSATLVPYAVSKMPSAFGLSNGTNAGEGVFALRTDLVIDQPLFLITKGEPDARIKKLIEAVRTITLREKAGV